MTITSGLMTSLTDEWATPLSLFQELDAEFSFTLDAAANAGNAKVANFFSKEDNGLIQDWRGVVWLNPPYGRTIGDWIRKAYESAGGGATVVCLVPARTDTRWWHDYAAKGEVRFIKGRVKFVDSEGKGSRPAPFPSAIVIFRSR